MREIRPITMSEVFEMVSFPRKHFRASLFRLFHRKTNSVCGIKLFEVKNMLINNLSDILVLSDSKIDDSYPESQFYAKGSKPNRQDRTNNKGGLIIYAGCDL